MLVILLVSFACNYVFGNIRNAEYNFTRIDTKKGLSHNQVHCIFKDSQGFIWIGTSSGLNRFDGYNFRVYRHIPSDPTSLIDNRIQRIFEDSYGKLWITLWDDYIIYDPKTEKFCYESELFQKNIEIQSGSISRVFQDNLGDIWFVTGQDEVFIYNSDTDSLVQLSYNRQHSSQVQNLKVSSATRSSEGDIWLLGYHGALEKLEKNTFDLLYRNTVLQERFRERRNLNLFIDSEDDLWIYSGDSDEGIFLFETKTGRFRHFHQNSSGFRLNNNIVNCVAEDNNGLIWVGTDHGGINIINKKDFSTSILLHNSDNPRSISQNSITTLYRDNEGIIWAGTYKKGVCYYHNDLYKFNLYQHQPNNPRSLPYNDVNCFQEDEKGNLWIGTNGDGLVYFDRKNDVFRSFRHDPSDAGSLSHNVIVSMLYDSEGILWLGTFYGGLNRFNGKYFKHYRNNPSDPGSLSNDRVWEIHEDSEKNLWIGTLGGGLSLFDRSTQTFKHFREGDPNSIHSDFILHITDDEQGRIWFGTSTGADCYDPQTGVFGHFSYNPENNNSLSHNVVSYVLVDSRKLVWLATQEGLNIYEPESNTFHRYYIDDGLPDNNILALLEDNKGNIWASTTNGIAQIKLNPPDGGGRYKLTFTHYSESDGLQGKEFNEGVALKTRRGELIFGGPNGFNIFNPNALTYNMRPPVVAITGLQIYNKNIGIGEKINGRVLLEKSINHTEELVLKHFEDIITIEFAALNYIHPEKNRYEYMLDGFNKDWMLAATDQRKATYTNLDPGEYVFRVRASNNDDVWNMEGVNLRIVVKPPFWKTKAAFFGYFIVLLFALFGLRYFILLKERFLVRIELEKQEARRRQEIDLLKIRFFTNVSHEFRTPLSLILSPLEKMLKKPKDEESESQLKLIYRNARRLLNLVNQLLDFRRMEVQKISLKPAYGDIVLFIGEIYQTFSDLAERKHIKFEFTSSHTTCFTWFDHDKLEKIVFNLLSNAFKFTPEGKEVSLELSVENASTGLSLPAEQNSNADRVILKVADSGIGIPAENIEKIFDRFFQNDLPGNLVSQGSGIGLSLTKEFVELHNGTISVKSEPGKGSCFTVVLPLLSGTEKEIPAEDISEQPSISYPDENTAMKTAGETKKALVLLVEDNDDFRFYLKDNLKDKYTIIESSNGNEGLAKAVGNLPDLIVSDVMMPEMDGFELCRRLKTNASTSHIPVILLTARMSEQKKQEGFETGADDYITKPFSFEMLESRMNNLIEQRERIRNAFQQHFTIEPGEIGITSLDEKLIGKALKLVEENMGNPDFTVEKLSRELGMSRVHLYKKLTALTGKTPIEFIRVMRLKRAKQLLGKSQLTVSEVAYEVGFNDPRYFSKYFKTEFGVLPSQYANSQKESENNRYQV